MSGVDSSFVSEWNVWGKQPYCCDRSLHGLLPSHLASGASAERQVHPNNEVPWPGSVCALQRRLEPGPSCSLGSCCTEEDEGAAFFLLPLWAACNMCSHVVVSLGGSGGAHTGAAVLANRFCTSRALPTGSLRGDESWALPSAVVFH